MGAKFREKRKLPSEINFVVLNFVPKAFAINYSYTCHALLWVLNFVTQGTVTKVTKFGTPEINLLYGVYWVAVLSFTFITALVFGGGGFLSSSYFLPLSIISE